MPSTGDSGLMSEKTFREAAIHIHRNPKKLEGRKREMKTLIGFTIALLCLTLTASATIRYVSAYGGGQYTTLSAAYTAAVSGDTILIGPGTYSESSIASTKRLAWVGA